MPGAASPFLFIYFFQGKILGGAEEKLLTQIITGVFTTLCSSPHYIFFSPVYPAFT